MLDLRKLVERLSFTGIFLYGIFLIGGCEPNPKMISYGSNEYSQLEFDGTNFEHQPLLENYSQVWAGKSFSLAMFGGPGMGPGGPGMGPPSLVCKGDSALGQCELPDTITMIMSSPYHFTDLKLGFNHGLLSYRLGGFPLKYLVPAIILLLGVTVPMDRIRCRNSLIQPQF